MLAKALRQLDYDAEKVSAKEFHDYITGETFSEDKTALRNVLDSEFLIIHESMIYEAHFPAMKYKLSYALLKKNYAWVETRLE